LVDTTQAPSDEKRTVDFPELLQNSKADLSKVNPLPKSEDFIDFLRKRALDDSVFVRKNALQVLENILKYYSCQQSQTKSDVEPITIELVSILSEHCRYGLIMLIFMVVAEFRSEILSSIFRGCYFCHQNMILHMHNHTVILPD
jgi:hypothetical protein